MTQQSYYWAYVLRNPYVRCSSIYNARTWKQSSSLISDEWIKKLWYIYAMKYYSAINRMNLSQF